MCRMRPYRLGKHVGAILQPSVHSVWDDRVKQQHYDAD